MKLEPDKQITLTQISLAMLLSRYGISDFTFEVIREGIANSSAVIQTGNKKYVARVYAQGKDVDDILFEISFQGYLRRAGVPIPVIQKNTNGKELTVFETEKRRWQAVLMDFVEGQSVTVNPSDVLIAQLATLHAKMHRMGMEVSKQLDRPKKLWKDLHDTLAVKVEKTTIGGQAVQDCIHRIKEYRYVLSPDLPYGYNHLDIDFDGNVITRGDHVMGIVDFDDVQYSPIVVCLGYTLWNILDDNGKEAMFRYLEVYEKIRPLTSSERSALPNVVFFRNYFMVMIRLLLWEEDTPIEDITDLICLEKEIPKMLSMV